METTYIFLTVITILLIVILIRVFIKETKEESTELTEIKNLVASLTQNLKGAETNLKNEFVTNRKEAAQGSKDLREEVSNQLNAFTKTFSDQLTALTKIIEDKFTSFQSTIETNNKESRKEDRKSTRLNSSHT